MPLQKAETLFDFTPTADVELKLKKGDVVIVRRMSVGEGWWEGEIDGKRGLFPSSYVKLLPSREECFSPERAKTPLTPRTSKKAFMETLLSPSHSIQDLTYDLDKAVELYVPGHTDIAITAGPRWECKPPKLTVVINDLQTETRFSGMKHTTLYQVETEELGAMVTRKYKNFLWLYDRLAENFPCISLPPLPVKHFAASTATDGVESKRKALEKFLNRVARHPVLASTKLFRDFLLQKDDRDWKIGRHSSHIKVPKSAKKLFNAPVYATIRYPPYNVPLHQLASIERFSRFSRTLEMNMATLQQSYGQLGVVHGEAMSGVNLLGRDLQRFARGLQQQPTTAATGFQRRKLAGVSLVQQLGITAVTNGQSTFHTPSFLPQHRGNAPAHLLQRGNTVDIEEEESGDETDCSAWNWRDDTRFDHMVKDLHDLATGMRHTGHLYSKYQAALDSVVLSNLEDYSGIIHTLPILVKLHEDAMEVFNYSKEKDSKKEAEEVRQNCETLNNILLAEFDYFSEVMIDDFEDMMSNFLLEQANLHRQLADEWEALHESYVEKRSQRSSTLSSRKRAYSSPHCSHSYSPSFTSSQESTSSLPGTRDRDSKDSKSSSRGRKSSLTKSQSAVTTTTSSSSASANAPMGVPTYINVQPMEASNEESDSEIDDELFFNKKKSETKTPQPDELETTDDVTDGSGSSLNKTVVDHQYSILEDGENSVDHDYAILEDGTERESESDHEGGSPRPSYTNMEFLIKSGSISSSSSLPAGEGVSCVKKQPKKPMPIQRKLQTATDEVPSDGQTQQQCDNESKATTSIPKKPLAPPQVQKPAKKQSTPDIVVPYSPSHSPAHLVQRPISPRPFSTSSYQTSRVADKSAPTRTQRDGGFRKSPETGEPEDLASTGNGVTGKKIPPPMAEGKPRSYTAIEQRKQPLLPPLTKPSLKSPTSFQRQHSNPPEAIVEIPESPVESVYRNRERSATERNQSTIAKHQPASRANSVNAASTTKTSPGKPNTDTPTGREELMRKLSLRRIKIEQQIALNSSNGKDSTGSTILTETSSSRTSTSSSQSEVVVAYKRIEDSLALSSSSSNGGVQLRKHEGHDKDLSKFGIIEDKEGGSFLI